MIELKHIGESDRLFPPFYIVKPDYQKAVLNEGITLLLTDDIFNKSVVLLRILDADTVMLNDKYEQAFVVSEFMDANVITKQITTSDAYLYICLLLEISKHKKLNTEEIDKLTYFKERILEIEPSLAPHTHT